jgi:hypothetical protein
MWLRATSDFCGQSSAPPRQPSRTSKEMDLQMPTVPVVSTESTAPVVLKEEPSVELEKVEVPQTNISLGTAVNLVIQDVKQAAKPVLDTLVKTETSSKVEPPRYRELQVAILRKHISALRDLGESARDHVLKPFWHATSWRGDFFWMSLYWTSIYFQLFFTGNLRWLFRLGPIVILIWSYFANRPDAPIVRTDSSAPAKSQSWSDWLGESADNARDAEEAVVWLVGILDGLRNIFSWRDQERAMWLMIGWTAFLALFKLTPFWMLELVAGFGLGFLLFILIPLCRNFPNFRRLVQDTLILKLLGGSYPVEYDDERREREKLQVEERVRDGKLVDEEAGRTAEHLAWLGIPKEEKLLGEWSCMLHLEPSGDLVAGRLFLTSFCLAFAGRDRKTTWNTQLRNLSTIRVSSVLPIGMDVGNVLEIVDCQGNKLTCSNFSDSTFEVHEVITKQFEQLGFTGEQEGGQGRGVVASLDQTKGVLLPITIVVSNPEISSPSMLPRWGWLKGLRHVSYLISTPSLGRSAKPVRHRWTELVELYEMLQKSEAKVPPLPAQLIHGVRKDEEFIEERREAAEDWLNQVASSEVSSTVGFRRFCNWAL